MLKGKFFSIHQRGWQARAIIGLFVRMNIYHHTIVHPLPSCPCCLTVWPEKGPWLGIANCYDCAGFVHCFSRLINFLHDNSPLNVLVPRARVELASHKRRSLNPMCLPVSPSGLVYSLTHFFACVFHTPRGKCVEIFTLFGYSCLTVESAKKEYDTKKTDTKKSCSEIVHDFS